MTKKPLKHAIPEPTMAAGASPARRRQALAALWSIVAACVVLGILRFGGMLNDPAVPLLRSEHGASWIFLDMPFSLRAYLTAQTSDWTVAFRKRFHVAQPVREARLTVRGFRAAGVQIDGEPIGLGNPDFQRWREPVSADIARWLTPGDHEIVIAARHGGGPPGVQAWCEPIGLVTDGSWEASFDGVAWSAARTADARRMTEYREKAFTGPEAISAVAAPLAGVALAVICAIWLWERKRTGIAPPREFSVASVIRCGLLLAWAVLIVHNITRLPDAMGFDRQGHFDYIRTVAERHRLPLANEGWQAFQSPLYYLLSAPVFWIASAFHSQDVLLRSLRIIGMLCGMAQIEIVFRTLRMVMPSKPWLQAIGAGLAGFLPMNLYISQSYGNEPLAGALIASTIGLMLATVYGSDRCRATGWAILLGAIWGLALLSKATALLLAGPIVVWLALTAWDRGERIVRIVGRLGAVFLAAGVVSGWYYVRNWIMLGRPFVGGWDPSRGIVWWQEPGYRTWKSVFAFGDSLIHPTAAHTMGLWDTLYATFWCDGFSSSVVAYDLRPPWADTYLIVGPLLGLFPMAMMLIGAAQTLIDRRAPARAASALSIGLVAVYLAAILDLYMRLPIYSTAKATYMLGLTPAFALLFAMGTDWIGRNAWTRRAIIGLFAAWLVAAYLAFFAK